VPSRSYDFDSPDFTANPYTTYAAMRRDDPIYRHEVNAPSGGPETVYSTGVSWYITRYEDAKVVLKDFNSFVHDFRLALSQEEQAKIPPAPPLMAALGANLTGVEPPQHTKLRGLVSQAFARKQVQEMADLVQQITDDLIAGVESRGEMELMEDFAYPLPIRVITGMLGLPFEDAHRLRQWTEVRPPESEKDIPAVMASLEGAKAYIDGHLERRRSQPTEDLITALLNAEVEGEKLEEIQLFSMIMMLVVAGFETTVNLLGNGLLALLDHPAEMEKLRSNPSLAAAAVEEVLRFDSPLEHALVRWVAKDIEFRGQQLERGDRIVVVQASANHDPEKFADPERFDIGRKNPPHFSFGHGIHYCLGAPLARVEAPIAFNSLLAKLPGLRLAVPREQVKYRPNLPFRGLASLPVRWDR